MLTSGKVTDELPRWLVPLQSRDFFVQKEKWKEIV